MRRAFRCSHRADKAAEHEPVRCNPWLRQYYEPDALCASSSSPLK